MTELDDLASAAIKYAVSLGYELPVPEPPTPPTPPEPPSIWKTAIYSEFASPGLPAPWTMRNYPRESTKTMYYAPQHVICLGDGILRLKLSYEPNGLNGYGAGWYAGTIDAPKNLSTVDFRLTTIWRRVQVGGIISHLNLPLRWPDSEKWPIDGEEDLAESEGSSVAAFYHYGTNNLHIDHMFPALDLTQFHTWRHQRLNNVMTTWIDDMTNPAYVYQGNTTTLPPTPKRCVYQQEIPYDGTKRSYNDAHRTGSDTVEIESILLEVPV